MRALTRLRWMPLVSLAAALAAISLAACGSSGGSDSTAQTGGSGTEAGGSTDAGVAASCQKAEKFSEEPAFKAPGGPTDGSVIKGKSVWAVVVFPSAPVQAYMETLNRAGSELGFDVTEVNAEGTVPKAASGIEQAIGQGADAIIVLAVPTESLQKPLEAAQAKGIKTIDVNNSTPQEPPPPGVEARVSWDFGEGGEARMAQAICETEGDVQGGLLSTLDIRVGNSIKAGMEKVMEEDCPDKCTLTSSDVPAAKWATGTAPATANLVQSNPDMNYLFSMFGGMTISALPTLKRVDPSGNIKLSSGDFEESLFDALKSGEIAQEAGTDLPADAWASVDQIIRLMNDEEPVIAAQPGRLITSEIANELGLSSSEGPQEAMAKLFPPNYVEGTTFKQLWGVE